MSDKLKRSLDILLNLPDRRPTPAEPKGSEPTDNEISRAAHAWCGAKGRETFGIDIEYFVGNWRSLPGLQSFVDAEIAKRSPTPAAQDAAGLAEMLAWLDVQIVRLRSTGPNAVYNTNVANKCERLAGLLRSLTADLAAREATIKGLQADRAHHDKLIPDLIETTAKHFAAREAAEATIAERAGEIADLTKALSGFSWAAGVYDGETLTIETIGNELADLRMILERVPKVYEHVTGGVLSKPHYDSDVVITYFNDHVEKLIEEATEETRQAAEQQVQALKALAENTAKAGLDINTFADHDGDCASNRDEEGGCNCGYSLASSMVFNLAEQVTAALSSTVEKG